MVNLELKAGKRRVEALRNLAERTAVDDLRKLVAVLIQADRFGTGISQSLRAHADYMRVQSRQHGRGEGRQAGREIGISDLFLYFAVAVRGDGWPGGHAHHAGIGPDDE